MGMWGGGASLGTGTRKIIGKQRQGPEVGGGGGREGAVEKRGKNIAA